MRHQIFKSARQLAKLAGRDLIYPSLLCFRYCMTYPGTYSCPPPPLCQHRWYLTAHPWTWCWCFTDTGKAFQSLVSSIRMNVLVLSSFGNLPDGWCLHSIYVLYVIEETASKTYTQFSLICFFQRENDWSYWNLFLKSEMPTCINF